MAKRVDCLDLFVHKMEGIRPACPVKTIEDLHTRATDLFVKLTPSIPICPTGEEPPPGGYCCPYCDECFGSLKELQDHVAIEHPGERIPIPIDWE